MQISALGRLLLTGVLLALEPPLVLAYEREPVLQAAELVSPSLLNGPGFAVAPQARVVGYQARFTLRTDFGEIEAESVEMLALRIAELPALEALHGAEASATFARAMSEATRARGDALEQVGRNPLRTLAGLPLGVARYFGLRLRRIGERAQKLGDRAARGIKEEGDPYDHADGAMSAARVTNDPDRVWHDKPRRELLNLVKGEVDYGRARRSLAQRLGIDPQTSNPLIRPRLDALSWIAVGGDQAAALALGALGADAAGALDAGGQMFDVVWKLDPVELRARNRARISAWCRDEVLLRRFLQHRAFNAQLQTALVEAVRDLAPASGCDALLETSLMATTEIEARFLVNALRLLRHHLGESAPGGRLRPLGATLVFHSREGELILPLAVDRLSWTRQLQRFFDSEKVAASRRTLLVTGSISPRAQRELTERGWSLVPHLPYPGAPAYSPSPVRPATPHEFTP